MRAGAERKPLPSTMYFFKYDSGKWIATICPENSSSPTIFSKGGFHLLLHNLQLVYLIKNKISTALIIQITIRKDLNNKIKAKTNIVGIEMILIVINQDILLSEMIQGGEGEAEDKEAGEADQMIDFIKDSKEM
jgi:hypothetical protein